MELGYLQQKIIEIGKRKGFVTNIDVKQFYSRKIEVEMNKLIALGFFKQVEDCITFIKWEYNQDAKEL